MDLGYAKIKREEYLSKQEKIYEFPITFKNENRPFPVIKIPIGMPKYRLGNMRTKFLQLEYIRKHGHGDNFFKDDLENIEAQTAQHTLLKQLSGSGDKNLIKYFEDNEQKYPIV